MLQHLARKIEGKIFRIDDTLDEAEPFGDEFFAVIGDENAPDVELDVVFLPLRFEEIERSTFGDEENRAEFQLTLDREVLDGEMVLPIVREGLVEAAIFLLSDV